MIEFVINIEVIMVLSNKFIWFIEMLNKVGSMSFLIFLMFLFCYFYLGWFSMWVWYKNGNWNSNWIRLFINMLMVSVYVFIENLLCRKIV